MRIGKLDQRIKLQSLNETSDEGSLSQAWVTMDTVAALVKSEHGNEVFESARVNARETIRIMIRDRTDITTKWRIEWLQQYYEIIAVDRSERRSGALWLTAQLVGAA